MGRITALEGRAVGIHLAFAPVADVNNNPDNPIINTRSFGEDPARGRPAWWPPRSAGCRTTGCWRPRSTFPGHGDTGTDSHLALPVIDADWRAARLGGAGAVPERDRGRREGGDVGPHRAARRSTRASSGRAPSRPTCSPASCATRSRFDGPGRDRRAQHGRHRQRLRRGGRRCAPFSPAPTCCSSRPIPAAAIAAMEAAVARGEITPERLDRSRAAGAPGQARPRPLHPPDGVARQRAGRGRQRPVPRRGAGDGRALDRDGEGRERHGARAPAREAADHAGDLRRKRRTARSAWRSRRSSGAWASRSTVVPALARQRPGELRLRRGRARPTAASRSSSPPTSRPRGAAPSACRSGCRR